MRAGVETRPYSCTFRRIRRGGLPCPPARYARDIRLHFGQKCTEVTVGRHPQMPPGHVSFSEPRWICLRQIVRLRRTGRSMSAPTAGTAGLRRRGRRPRRPAPTYRNGKRTVQWAAPSRYGTERILGSAQNDAIGVQEQPRPLFPLPQLLRLLLRLPGLLWLPPGAVQAFQPVIMVRFLRL